jgi:hypothetical protein
VIDGRQFLTQFFARFGHATKISGYKIYNYGTKGENIRKQLCTLT